MPKEKRTHGMCVLFLYNPKNDIMKKTHLFLALIVFAAAMTACDSERQQIREAAKGYLDGVANYDFDAAEPYATAETREQTFTFFRQITEVTDTNYIKSNTPATIRIKRVKKSSDSTATVFYHKSTPIKEVDDSVLVVKQGEQWLVETLIEVPPMVQFMINAKKDSTLLQRNVEYGEEIGKTRLPEE